jgi:hypothetical protein
MKELKIKSLWAVDINNIQWTTFKYKKEAKNFAIYLKEIGVNGKPNILKRKVITDKY